MAKATSTSKVTFGKGQKKRKGIHAKNKSSWNHKSKNYKKRTMAKVDKHEDIRVCGFSVSIYERPKHYEAQFIYCNPNNMDSRIEKSIDYLGKEGFFKENKRIKATTIHLSNSYPSDNPNE